jgi:hypothetical protein
MDVYGVCIVKTALAWVWPVGSYTELHGVYTQRTRALLTVHAVDGDACALGPFARPSRDQPPAANHPVDLHGSPHDSRSRPIACPPSTRAHHAAERSVSASPISRNQRSSAERSCRCAQTHTAVSIAPSLPSSNGTSHAGSQEAKAKPPSHVVAASRWRPRAAVVHAVPRR